MFNAQYYFKNIAQAHRYIAHGSGGRDSFFMITDLLNNEIEAMDLNNMQGMSLILFTDIEGKINDAAANNHISSEYYSFMIINNAVDFANTDAVESIQESCKSVMFDVFSWMKRDWKEAQEKPETEDGIGIRNLNVNSFSYRSIGPLYNNYYGMMASFTLDLNKPIHWKEFRWLRTR